MSQLEIGKELLNSRFGGRKEVELLSEIGDLVTKGVEEFASFSEAFAG
jgi:hypothetical protein